MSMNNKYIWGIIGVLVIATGAWLMMGDKTTPSPVAKTGVIEMNAETVTPRAIEMPTVTYTNEGFSPAVLTVKEGTVVTFINGSNSPMWVASGAHPTHLLYPEFDAKTSAPKGGSYSFTFDKIGEYPYHNHMLLGKYGKVIVE